MKTVLLFQETNRLSYVGANERSCDIFKRRVSPVASLVVYSRKKMKTGKNLFETVVNKMIKKKYKSLIKYESNFINVWRSLVRKLTTHLY